MSVLLKYIHSGFEKYWFTVCNFKTYQCLQSWGVDFFQKCQALADSLYTLSWDCLLQITRSTYIFFALLRKRMHFARKEQLHSSSSLASAELLQMHIGITEIRIWPQVFWHLGHMLYIGRYMWGLYDFLWEIHYT